MDAGEGLEEELALMTLRLTVLRGSATERLVELHRLISSNALLVLRDLCAEPKEDVMHECGALRPLSRLKANVGVAVVKVAVHLDRHQLWHH